MSTGKWKLRRDVAELETMISVTKEAKVREILELLPPGVPLNKLKFMFVDKVVTANKGNLAASCRELCIPYRTITNWMHETDHLISESRGRTVAGMEKAKFRKKTN